MRRLAALAFLAAACAHAPKKEVVWPDPPEKPRIRFVQAFRNSDDLDDSGWTRTKRTLLGGGADTALGQPMGLALSDDGKRLYISDLMARHVMLADLDRRTLAPFAPDEAMGNPFAVALDAEENVYVSDTSGRQVIVFSKSGARLRAIGAGKLERPTGLALDKARGLLYVADSATKESAQHTVRAFKLDGEHVRDVGNGRGSGPGQFFFPVYLTVDAEGNLYVGDTMNFRIQTFSPDGTFLSAFGEVGDGPGTFDKLKGIAFDGFGNLYAVDGGHSNVQIFNRDRQTLMFFGAYAKRLEYFDIPSGIAIDPKTNRIYVCNEYIARINVYELVNTTADDCRSPASPPAVPAAAPEVSPAQVERPAK